MLETIKNYAQTQLMFSASEIGGANFSGPGSVTYCIKPNEDGWLILQKDTNAVRSTPFGTYGKEKWTTEEVKDFFVSQDFKTLKMAKAFKSEEESVDITTKEEFLSMFS
jgi:hypothetical protein